MKKLVLTLIIILYPFLSWSENIYLCKQKLISRIDFDLERQEWFDVMTEKSRNLMKGGSWVKGFRISFTNSL